MPRVILASLRRRAGRSLALLLGVLMATTGFTVLTASTETSRLQVTGTVSEHSRGAYDILVRPAGTATTLEQERRLVQPNFLASAYGGITADQWREIRDLPGVEIAAPVAMLGYTSGYFTEVELDITDAVDFDARRQLIEVRPRWYADRGLSSAVDDRDELVGYVYVTRDPVAWPRWDEAQAPEGGPGVPAEAPYTDGVRREGDACGGSRGVAGLEPYELRDDGAAPVCVSEAPGPLPRVLTNAVHLTGDDTFEMGGFHSAVRNDDDAPATRERLTVQVRVPRLLTLVAAVDPAAEAQLVGLDDALVDGRYLAPDGETVQLQQGPGQTVPGEPRQAPALVSARPYVDEQVAAEARQVEWDGSTLPGQAPGAVATVLADNPRGPASVGEPVDLVDGHVGDLERSLELPDRVPPEAGGSVLSGTVAPLGQRIETGPARLAEDPDGTLRPEPHPPVADDWPEEGRSPWQEVPPDSVLARDLSFRELDFGGTDRAGLGDLHSTVAVGLFDPDLLAGVEGLAQVPMATYTPSHAVGADPETRDVLGDRPLLPAGSTPAGYLATPPMALIALGTLLEYSEDPAPVSAVRVRVADVTGFDPLSRERVRATAEQIAEATGLDVDVVFGSSPAPQQVALPAGDLGRPELRLAEEWSLKGAAVAIIDAVDRKSAALFGLILVVCVLFVANTTAAAVRDRRGELAVLACLGWPRWRLGLAIGGEVGAVGLVAGVLGALAAPPLGALTGIDVPAGQAWLPVPVALGLALVAAAVPAWRASRADPGAAVAPAVAAPRARARQRRGVLSMALGNLFRVPGRTLLGVAALAVGVGGLTLLAAVTLAFHGAVTGSLLGDAVSVRIRGVDAVAVAATVLLGLVAVADVLYVNIRERAAELATLRATGWSSAALGRLVAYEGLAMGALGGVLGAGVALAGAAWFAGVLPPALLATATAVAAGGAVLAGLAALVPAWRQRAIPMAVLLAEE